MTNVNEVLQQRGNRYGTFKDNAATTQALEDVCRQGPSWDTLSAHHKEAIHMICHKLARIVNGDPNYDDSWVDIAGYSQLVVNIIKGQE